MKAIGWTEYLSTDTTFAVDSVVFSPEFHHSKFVAYKVKDAIADQFRERTGQRPNVSVSNPDIQLHIHISDYDATLALDSSGESLHRRGYRTESVAAPLNEVLAAGIILIHSTAKASSTTVHSAEVALCALRLLSLPVV